MRTYFRQLCALGLCFLLTNCAAVPPTEQRQLQPILFGDLPGWQQDDVDAALPAFVKSCARQQEQVLCAQLIAEKNLAGFNFRRFLEKYTQPYRITAGGNAPGLMTGYYEPLLRGSRTPSATYHVPLYGIPDDLITVDLGLFKTALQGQSIVGRVEGKTLQPYADRAEVAQNGLAGKADALVWVDDPVAAFFLEIQGSGRVQLPDGSVMRLGYAGKNGRAYTAIGKVMKARGLLQEKVTMPMIRDWLKNNPDDMQAMLNENASVVFFREIKGEGPIGAEGVPLTPERSVAVDPTAITLGTLLWVDAEGAHDGEPRWQKLMVAQDTGGAIKGIVRADLFMGFGPRAERLAGAMQSQGSLYLLLPK